MTNQKTSTLDYTTDGRVLLNVFGKTKTIGHIRDRVFYKTILSEIHLMRCNNSIGINLDLIKDAKFDIALITMDGRKLEISREHIRLKGQIMSFPKSKTEAQIFVPVNAFSVVIEPESKTKLSDITLRGKSVYRPPQHRQPPQTSMVF